MSQDNQVAAKDTTFDGVVPKSVWISTRSSPDRKYIKVYLEINGIEKEIESVYVGNYDGILSSSTQITWVVLQALDELKAENERLKNVISIRDKLIVNEWSPSAYSAIKNLEHQNTELQLAWANAETKLNEKYTTALIERDQLKNEVENLKLRLDRAYIGKPMLQHRQETFEEEINLLKQALREMVGALERLTKVGPPSVPTTGAEWASQCLKDNCEIAKDSLAKHADLIGKLK